MQNAGTDMTCNIQSLSSGPVEQWPLGSTSSSTFCPTSSSPVKALKFLQKWQDLISTSCYIIARNLKSLEIFLATIRASIVITIYPSVPDACFLYDIRDRNSPSQDTLTTGINLDNLLKSNSDENLMLPTIYILLKCLSANSKTTCK